MPKRIDDATEIVTFEFEGHPIEARAGDTVAAALSARGHPPSARQHGVGRSARHLLHDGRLF